MFSLFSFVLKSLFGYVWSLSLGCIFLLFSGFSSLLPPPPSLPQHTIIDLYELSERLFFSWLQQVLSLAHNSFFFYFLCLFFSIFRRFFCSGFFLVLSSFFSLHTSSVFRALLAFVFVWQMRLRFDCLRVVYSIGHARIMISLSLLFHTNKIRHLEKKTNSRNKHRRKKFLLVSFIIQRGKGKWNLKHISMTIKMGERERERENPLKGKCARPTHYEVWAG